MSRLGWMAFGVVAIVASARCTYPNFVFDGAAGGAGGGGTTGSGGLTCAAVDGTYGCCDANGVVHYCMDGVNVMDLMCSIGSSCGWNDGKQYYDCVLSPGGPDPTFQHPMACGQ